MGKFEMDQANMSTHARSGTCLHPAMVCIIHTEELCIVWHEMPSELYSQMFYRGQAEQAHNMMHFSQFH